jgi:hypothetical protein
MARPSLRQKRGRCCTGRRVGPARRGRGLPWNGWAFWPSGGGPAFLLTLTGTAERGGGVVYSTVVPAPGICTN